MQMESIIFVITSAVTFYIFAETQCESVVQEERMNWIAGGRKYA